MNKNINLFEWLKCYEGEYFYCILTGTNVRYIGYDTTHKCLLFESCDSVTTPFEIFSNGALYPNGECVIFPTKNQRDWNKWYEEHKTPKIWSRIKENITLGCTASTNLTVDGPQHGGNLIEEAALATLKLLKLIEISYGGLKIADGETCNWPGSGKSYGITLHTTLSDCYDGIDFRISELHNDVNSPIKFKEKKDAEEFLKHEENQMLLRIANMVAYRRDFTNTI